MGRWGRRDDHVHLRWSMAFNDEHGDLHLHRRFILRHWHLAYVRMQRNTIDHQQRHEHVFLQCKFPTEPR